MTDFCISGSRLRCRRNSYNEHEGGAGQAACTPCPSTSTSGEGSSALADCRCPAQFYHAPVLNGSHLYPSASSLFECRPAPAGTDTSSNGTLLETLPLLGGYWRISRGSSDVRRCPDAERGNGSACLGGSGEPCAAGLQGIFCERECSIATHTLKRACSHCDRARVRHLWPTMCRATFVARRRMYGGQLTLLCHRLALLLV